MNNIKTCSKCKNIKPFYFTCYSCGKIGKVCIDCDDWKINDKFNICCECRLNMLSNLSIRNIFFNANENLRR